MTKIDKKKKEKLIKEEYNRIYKLFDKSDERKKSLLEGLMLEASKTKIDLLELNQIASQSGLIRFNPKNPMQQKPTVVANEIVKYRNSYNHILNSLAKHLSEFDETLQKELEGLNNIMGIL